MALHSTGCLSTGKIIHCLPAYVQLKKWKYDILVSAAAQVFLMIYSVLLIHIISLPTQDIKKYF